MVHRQLLNQYLSEGSITMSKKLLTVFFAMLLALAFVACGDDNGGGGGAKEPATILAFRLGF